MSPPWPFGFEAKDWVAVPTTMASARSATAGIIRLMGSTSIRRRGWRRIRRMPNPIRPAYYGRVAAPVCPRVPAPRLFEASGRRNLIGLTCLPDRLDQIPLAHPGPAGDVLSLCDVVEILPGAILEVVAGLPAAGPGLRGLAAEILTHRLRQVQDRLLRSGGLSRLHDVPLGRPHLFLRRHAASPP